MPVQARYSARLGLVVLIGASMAALTGCGSLDGASSRIANIVKPYRVCLLYTSELPTKA